MEKRIEFSGVDNGVSSMISKLRQDTRDLGVDLIRDAQQYSTSTQSQVGYIQEQIRAIEQRNKVELESNKIIAQRQFESQLGNAKTKDERDKVKQSYSGQLSNFEESARLDRMQVTLLRELIDTIKNDAKEGIVQDRAGVERRVRDFQAGRLPSVSEEEALRLGYQQDILGMGRGGSMTSSVFQGMIGANLMKEIGNIFQKFPSAKDELDFITPFSQMSGMATGGGVGSLMDLANVKILGSGAGEADFGVVGMEIGRQMGSMLGEGLTRVFRTREELFKTELGIKGLAGGYDGYDPSNKEASNLVRFGLDRTQGAELTRSVVTASGTIRGADEQTIQAAALEKAFSFDKGLVQSQFRQSRVSTDDTNVLQIISQSFEQLVQRGIMTEDDRVLFGEFISNSNQLVDTFSQVSEKVDADRAREIMMMFNQIGGEFSVGDPRAMGNVQSIQQTLSNPGSDYIKALSFQAIRELPGMEGSSLWDMMKAQKKGLETPGYLNAMVGKVSDYGQGEGMREVMLSQLFQQLDPDTIERLLKSYDQNGSITTEQAKKAAEGSFKFSDKDILKQGEENVSGLQKTAANINNAFVDGMYKSITTVSETFVNAMGMSIDEISSDFKSKIMEAVKDALSSTTKETPIKEQIKRAEDLKQFYDGPKHSVLGTRGGGSFF